MARFPARNALLALFAVVLSAAFARADTNGAAPGKIYVSSLDGEAFIESTGRRAKLKNKYAYPVASPVIETAAGTRTSLVFSNGTAFYLGPEARFDVTHFSQRSFQPGRSDLDAEPSDSRTVLELRRGTFGICTARLARGSSMFLHTPHATVDVRGRKLLVEVSSDETRVLLIEGEITVGLRDSAQPRPLRPGQQAIVRLSRRGDATLSIQPVMDEQQAWLDATVSAACFARRTVFFDVDRHTAEIGVFEVAPRDAEGGFILSPARIGGVMEK